MIDLRGLLNADAGTGIGDLHVELLGALDDGLTSPGGDVVGDLRGVFSMKNEYRMKRKDS
jgi:hypothetical protein